MKTELKDVIHLYLGCVVEIIADGQRGQLLSVDMENHLQVVWGGDTLESWQFRNIETPEEIKLLLRPLDSMMEEDLQQIGYQDGHDVKDFTVEDWSLTYYSPQQFLYLLKNSFDLFGGIQQGWAIDLTKIQK